MSIYRWMKSFVIDELVDKDMEFYSELDELNEDMSEIVNLYNKVRNYVTQKPYSQEKIKLNFGSPTLADGWSKSKEFDNNAIILIRDEKYIWQYLTQEINQLRLLYQDTMFAILKQIIRK